MVLHIVIFNLLATLCDVQLVFNMQGKAAKLLTMTFHHSSSFFIYFMLLPLPQTARAFRTLVRGPPSSTCTIIRSHSKSIVLMSHGFFFHRLTTEGKYHEHGGNMEQPYVFSPCPVYMRGVLISPTS